MGRRKRGLPGYDDLIEQMAGGYLSGQSLRDLAASCGVSVPTAKEWLKRAGVSIRSSGEGTRLQYARNGGKPKYFIPEDDLRQEYLIEGKAVWRIAKDHG